MKKFLNFILIVFLFILSTGYRNQTMASTPVNIVFTTDSNYVKPCRVAVFSAIQNKNPKSVYNINIVAVDLTQEEQNSIKKLATKNVNINIVPVKLDSIKDVGNYEIRRKSVHRADLFKFFMPKLFPNLDRILYIDCDTLILKDLSEVYNTDFQDRYIAVCLLGNYTPIPKDIVIQPYNKPFTNFCCGVIVFNLKKWRENDITSKLIDAKNKDTARNMMTQSAFKSVFKPGDFVILDPIYNAKPRWIDDSGYWRQGNKIVDRTTLDKAVILHYSMEKPWGEKITALMHLWWDYSEKLDEFDKERK